MSCTVIVVSYNTRALVVKCLDRLCTTTRAALEIIVIDNASDDGSAEAISAAHPEVRLFRNSLNRGFAAAVNQGLARATGDTILLLNPDTLVEPEAIDKLLEVLAASPGLGAVGPMVTSPEGAPQHHCAARELSLGRQLAWHFRLPVSRLHLGDSVGPHGARATERISGAALAIRRQAVEAIGLLDERFFLYFEDADWILRLRRAGFAVACVTEARVVHELGASGRKDPVARSAHAIDSELAYFSKHGSAVETLVLRAGILVSTVFRAVSVDAFRSIFPEGRHRLRTDLRVMKSCLIP